MLLWRNISFIPSGLYCLTPPLGSSAFLWLKGKKGMCKVYLPTFLTLSLVLGQKLPTGLQYLYGICLSHVARSSYVRIVLAYPWHLTHVTHAFTCDHGSFVPNTSIVHSPHDFLLPFQGVKVPYVVVAAAVVVVPGCWQHDNIARSSLHVLRMWNN